MIMSIRTILVVEDDFIQRRQMVRALEGAGYGLFQASDGLEAIRVLSCRKIHLVSTDIRMPCLDGISLMKYIRIFFPRIPVVVATGHPVEIGDLKPDALLTKPFGPEMLISCIDRII
jgi:two-component system response regulator FlrC